LLLVLLWLLLSLLFLVIVVALVVLGGGVLVMRVHDCVHESARTLGTNGAANKHPSQPRLSTRRRHVCSKCNCNTLRSRHRSRSSNSSSSRSNFPAAATSRKSKNTTNIHSRGSPPPHHDPPPHHHHHQPRPLPTVSLLPYSQRGEEEVTVQGLPDERRVLRLLGDVLGHECGAVHDVAHVQALANKVAPVLELAPARLRQLLALDVLRHSLIGGALMLEPPPVAAVAASAAVAGVGGCHGRWQVGRRGSGKGGWRATAAAWRPLAIVLLVRQGRELVDLLVGRIVVSTCSTTNTTATATATACAGGGLLGALRRGAWWPLLLLVAGAHCHSPRSLTIDETRGHSTKEAKAGSAPCEEEEAISCVWSGMPPQRTTRLPA
jgi:hypothetical protein